MERREGIEPIVLSLEDCSSTIELTPRCLLAALVGCVGLFLPQVPPCSSGLTRCHGDQSISPGVWVPTYPRWLALPSAPQQAKSPYHISRRIGIPMRAFALIAMFLLTGCDNGPTETDMAGCAVRSGGPPISTREVADCAVNRAELRRERESGDRK